MADQLPPSPQGQVYGEPPAQQRSWFSRNWGWVLGCGCLSVLVGVAAVVALVAMFSVSAVKGAIKDSDIYKVTMQQVVNSPAAKQQLGTPIEGGYMVGGKVNIQNDSGSADLSIPVSGPKASGTAKVQATLINGKWNITSLVLQVEGQAAPVVIVGPGAGGNISG